MCKIAVYGNYCKDGVEMIVHRHVEEISPMNSCKRYHCLDCHQVFEEGLNRPVVADEKFLADYIALDENVVFCTKAYDKPSIERFAMEWKKSVHNHNP